MLKETETILDKSFNACFKAFFYAFLFSLVMNLLTLAMPLYSLQILDRVLSTGSMDTLLMLSLIVVASFICLSILQGTRSYIFLEISNFLEKKLSPTLFKNVIHSAALNTADTGNQGLRDLSIIQSFITQQGLKTSFDIIWTPIFLIALYFIHPAYALIAIFGMVSLLSLALLNEKLTLKKLEAANMYKVASIKEVEGATRNSEIIEAMGMSSNILSNWQDVHEKAIYYQNKSTYMSIMTSAFTQFTRLFCQMLVMGVGAFLVLRGATSPGGIIAAAILSTKVLMPFDMAITTYRNLRNTIDAYSRISYSLKTIKSRKQNNNLPEPKAIVSVDRVIYQPKGASEPLIKGITLQIPEGKIIGVIGKSGSGKSVLAKLLAGIWKPTSGKIRLDSIDIYDWGRDYIKNYIGYAPQKTIFFNGTIRENIAKMDRNPPDEKVFQCTSLTDTHKSFLKLPHGYETIIGKGATVLSEGILRQISLARAFYDSPKLIILDEPQANLDHEAKVSLTNAIKTIKNKKNTIVLISNNQDLLAHADTVIYIENGMIKDHGPVEYMTRNYLTTNDQEAYQDKQNKKTPRKKSA